MKHLDLSTSWLDLPREHLEACCFARAVLAKQRETLVLSHGKACIDQGIWSNSNEFASSSNLLLSLWMTEAAAFGTLLRSILVNFRKLFDFD